MELSRSESDMDTSATKARHLPTGLVKFPPNIHGIYVERSRNSGRVTLVLRQNDTYLRFVLDDDDCRHLAALLVPHA